MADYDAEISIQDVNLLNAKILLDGWMYVTVRDKKNPACFAPYFTEEGRKESIPSGISIVSRVICSEDVVLSVGTRGWRNPAERGAPPAMARRVDHDC